MTFAFDDYEVGLDDPQGWKVSKEKYSYKGIIDGFTTVQLLLDFTPGKESWKLKIGKADFGGFVDPADGLDVRLQVGNYEGGLHLVPSQKTVLSYPTKQ